MDFILTIVPRLSFVMYGVARDGVVLDRGGMIYC